MSTAEYQRQWRLNNKEANKLLEFRNQFRRYGMTPEQFQQQANLQCGTCAICGDIPARWRGEEFIRGLSIDHDRKCCPGDRSCGECIRGLICNECNFILGRVHDDTRILTNMLAYLAEHASGSLNQ